MMIRINEAARYSFMQVRFAGRFAIPSEPN